LKIECEPLSFFPGFLEELHLVTILLNRRGAITYCNRAFERLSGWNRDEAVGRDWFDTFIPAGQRAAIRGIFRKAVHAGEMAFTYRNEITDRRGNRHLIAWNNAEVRDASGRPTGIVSFGDDITEREKTGKEMERYARQLRYLSRQLLEVQENERRHIARELHDEIGQSLTAIKVNLENMQREAQLPAERFDTSLAITADVLQRVRNLSLELRPAILDDLGLIPALRWYLDRMARSSNLSVHFTADPSVRRLPFTLETTCFRVAQEAMTNSVRHARARRLSVELWKMREHLQLVVRDDGSGFDVPASRRQNTRGMSAGLLGMQERVSLAGGTLDIRSQQGQGTELRACFPLQPEMHREDRGKRDRRKDG